MLQDRQIDRMILKMQRLQSMYEGHLVSRVIHPEVTIEIHGVKAPATEGMQWGKDFATATFSFTVQGILEGEKYYLTAQTGAPEHLVCVNGKKVGIVTDDLMTGATPTAFTVHNASRNNTGELINAMVQFTPDVLIGKDYMNTYGPLDDTSRPIFNDTYLVAKDFDKFQKVLDTDPTCQKPFMGFLNGYSSVASYQLAQAAQVAFKRLQNDKGFFLMIESCGTDKYGANNNMTGKLNSVVTLDRAVAAALLFMQDNPDTLLIVTSDHETGGVQIPAEGADPDTAFTTKEHTDAPVRVFALGAGAEYFHNKTVDNTDIAKFVIDALRGE